MKVRLPHAPSPRASSSRRCPAKYPSSHHASSSGVSIIIVLVSGLADIWVIPLHKPTPLYDIYRGGQLAAYEPHVIFVIVRRDSRFIHKIKINLSYCYIIFNFNFLLICLGIKKLWNYLKMTYKHFSFWNYCTYPCGPNMNLFMLVTTDICAHIIYKRLTTCCFNR
jgi:hypothetical protein